MPYLVLYILSALFILAAAFWLGRKTGPCTAKFEQLVEAAQKQVSNATKKADDLTGQLAVSSKELACEKMSYEAVSEDLELTRSELKKVTSQKKSSEVRTGLIAEQLAPFLEDFAYNPKRAKFLGQPIDFVVFDDDGVHFVEVKSGNSQLSSSQRAIRNQIKDGRVTFEIYRIKGE